MLPDLEFIRAVQLRGWERKENILKEKLADDD